VRPVVVDAGPEPGFATIHWQVSNLSGKPVELLETSLPHGRCFGERLPVEPPIVLAPLATAALQRTVRLSAGPGETVENAFLILRVRTAGQEWRVLARMRMTRATDGRADVQVESVTAQPVGFSEMAVPPD
jgi:hypothetical protein